MKSEDLIYGDDAAKALNAETFDADVKQLFSVLSRIQCIVSPLDKDRQGVQVFLEGITRDLRQLVDGEMMPGECPEDAIPEMAMEFRRMLMDELHYRWDDLTGDSWNEPRHTYYMSVDAAVRGFIARLTTGRHWQLAASVTYHEWMEGSWGPEHPSGQVDLDKWAGKIDARIEEIENENDIQDSLYESRAQEIARWKEKSV